MLELPKKSEIPLVRAAQRIGRSYHRTYRLLLTGELRGRQIGARWYCELADVERLEQERDERVSQPA